jgi:hypothetical protein
MTAVFAGDFTQLLIGQRLDLTVQTLVERYAELGQIGIIAHWRGDVGIARPGVRGVPLPEVQLMLREAREMVEDLRTQERADAAAAEVGVLVPGHVHFGDLVYLPGATAARRVAAAFRAQRPEPGQHSLVTDRLVGFRGRLLPWRRNDEASLIVDQAALNGGLDAAPCCGRW